MNELTQRDVFAGFALLAIAIVDELSTRAANEELLRRHIEQDREGLPKPHESRLSLGLLDGFDSTRPGMSVAIGEDIARDAFALADALVKASEVQRENVPATDAA